MICVTARHFLEEHSSLGLIFHIQSYVNPRLLWTCSGSPGLVVKVRGTTKPIAGRGSRVRFLLVFIILVVVCCCWLPPTLQAADTASEIYAERCAVCHGPTGRADTPVARKHNLRPFTAPEFQNRSEEAIVDSILNGGPLKRASHQFSRKGVTPEQATQLAIFVKQLGRN
ncbi:MAG TPA: cytochrome c [Candidatus Acidoferrales bacterium]|nr:cytochrome c [Candidatus Acidoferrales bacterium]